MIVPMKASEKPPEADSLKPDAAAGGLTNSLDDAAPASHAALNGSGQRGPPFVPGQEIGSFAHRLKNICQVVDHTLQTEIQFRLRCHGLT